MIKYFILIIIFLGCAPSTNQSPSSKEEAPPKVWTTPTVEGQWKRVHSEMVKDIPFLGIYNDSSVFEPLPQEYQPPLHDYSDYLIFEEDSIYYLDYPIKIMHQRTYRLDSGYLHINTSVEDNYQFESKTPIKYINDTLYLYISHVDGPPYLKVGYIKHRLDDSIVYQLKKYGTNYPALSGTWILLRNYWEGYGDYYELDFPYTVPDSIHITKEELIALQDKECVYQMRTNGQMRDYTLSYYPPFLCLTPQDWCEPEEVEGYDIEDCEVLTFNHTTDYPAAGIYSGNVPDEENHMKEE